MSDKREAYKDRNSTPSALESALKTKIKTDRDMRTTIATKFVAWEVPTLESLRNSKVYRLRVKLNNGENLSREEKDWLTRNVNDNTYFKGAVPLLGWRFDFSDVLRTFIVNQYGQWSEYKATDKTALRRACTAGFTALWNLTVKLRYDGNGRIRHNQVVWCELGFSI